MNDDTSAPEISFHDDAEPYSLFDVAFLSRRTRVIVATPDRALTEALATALADDGHEVLPFDDQWRALRHLRGAGPDQIPDLVLLGDDGEAEAQVLAFAVRSIDDELPCLVVDASRSAPTWRWSLNDSASLRCAPDTEEVRFAVRLLLEHAARVALRAGVPTASPGHHPDQSLDQSV